MCDPFAVALIVHSRPKLHGEIRCLSDHVIELCEQRLKLFRGEIRYAAIVMTSSLELLSFAARPRC
jgi:hypothetical protein